MANSEQEIIVHNLGQYSLGAPFIFEPDEIQGKGKTREPADLVWVVDDCIILINMQKTKKKTAEKMYSHNLQQLRGWLRNWRNGEALKGKNKYQTFNISYKDIKHVVLLSVIDGEKAVAQGHPDFTEQLRQEGYAVVLSATLPGKTFAAFTEYGGGALELIEVLRITATTKVPLPETVATASIQKRYKTMLHQLAGGDLTKYIKDFDDVLRKVIALRAQTDHFLQGENGVNQDFITVLSTMNDLTWSEQCQIVLNIQYIKDQINQVPAGAQGIRAAAAIVEAKPYVILVGVEDRLGRHDFEKELAETFKTCGKDPAYPPLMILWEMQRWNGIMLMAGAPRTGPTRAAIALDSLTSKAQQNNPIALQINKAPTLTNCLTWLKKKLITFLRILGK